MIYVDDKQKIVKYRKVKFDEEADISMIYLTIFVSYTGKTYYEEYSGKIADDGIYNFECRFVDPEPLIILADKLKDTLWSSVWKMERPVSSIN